MWTFGPPSYGAPSHPKWLPSPHGSETLLGILACAALSYTLLGCRFSRRWCLLACVCDYVKSEICAALRPRWLEVFPPHDDATWRDLTRNCLTEQLKDVIWNQERLFLTIPIDVGAVEENVGGFLFYTGRFFPAGVFISAKHAFLMKILWYIYSTTSQQFFRALHLLKKSQLYRHWILITKKSNPKWPRFFSQVCSCCVSLIIRAGIVWVYKRNFANTWKKVVLASSPVCLFRC